MTGKDSRHDDGLIVKGISVDFEVEDGPVSGIQLMRVWLSSDPRLRGDYWGTRAAWVLTFLHHGTEEVERHLLWEFHKKIQRKSWSNVSPKLLACMRFHKLYTKTAISESSIAHGRLMAHLFIMFVAAEGASDFLIFAQGLSYGLSKSKKRGKIITKLWKIISP